MIAENLTMKKTISSFLSFIILLEFLVFPRELFAVEQKDEEKSRSKYNLDELVFPQEVKDMGKSQGSIYYSSPIKNKILIPTHIWGQIGKSGLHFIPNDSTLIKALTYAGGVTTDSKQDEIKLSRFENGELKTFEFDLEDGGDELAHKFVVKPGDTIYVPKSQYYVNRSFYTSLIGVAVSLLSGILVYRAVKKGE